MTITPRLALTAAIAALGVAMISAPAFTQDKMPFGDKKDVNFAEELWRVMKQSKMVGPNRLNSKAFEGNEPHGAIQQVLALDIKMRGRTGRAIVKMNHMGGEGVKVEDVYANPGKYLAAYTVMFKREKGYDTENKDWFWAKYDAKGNLDVMMPGSPKMAGRIAKGMPEGCIACHVGAGGDDLEVLTPN
jgi:hypothetical protein